MISILIPSRARPMLLHSSVLSLLGRATDVSNVEILVAADPDDTPTHERAWELGVDLYITTTRYGYARLHEYYNLLASHASGDWLYLWNDDAVMLSPRWDEVILEQPTTHVLQTVRKTRFPVIPAHWVRHLGHLSLNRHSDSWWDELGKLIDRKLRLPIEGAHVVPEDQTAAEREYDVEGFIEMRELIAKDAEKLEEIL